MVELLNVALWDPGCNYDEGKVASGRVGSSFGICKIRIHGRRNYGYIDHSCRLISSNSTPSFP